MAIGHFAVRGHSRAKGHTVAGAFAYRGGTELRCPRTGILHDYRHKGGVLYSKILSAVVTPLTASVPVLVAGLEGAEKRKDAQILRDLQYAVPDELSVANAIVLTGTFSLRTSARYETPVYCALHGPTEPSDGDRRNLHGHTLLPTRRINENGVFGEKLTELDRAPASRAEVLWLRKTWEECANEMLASLGLTARVDVGRRADGDPAPTLGPERTGLERRAQKRRAREGGDPDAETCTHGVPIADLVRNGNAVTETGHRLAQHGSRRRRRLRERVRRQGDTAADLLSPVPALPSVTEPALAPLVPPPALAPLPAVPLVTKPTLAPLIPPPALAPLPAVPLVTKPTLAPLVPPPALAPLPAVPLVTKPTLAPLIPPPALAPLPAVPLVTKPTLAPLVPPPALAPLPAVPLVTKPTLAPLVPPPALAPLPAVPLVTKPTLAPLVVGPWPVLVERVARVTSALHHLLHVAPARLAMRRLQTQLRTLPPVNPTPAEIADAHEYLDTDRGGGALAAVVDEIGRQRFGGGWESGEWSDEAKARQRSIAQRLHDPLRFVRVVDAASSARCAAVLLDQALVTVAHSTLGQCAPPRRPADGPEQDEDKLNAWQRTTATTRAAWTTLVPTLVARVRALITPIEVLTQRVRRQAAEVQAAAEAADRTRDG